MERSRLYGILALVMLALIAFVGIRYSNATDVEEKTGRDIAADAVKFVYSALNTETGYFHLTYECRANECTPKEESGKPPHSGYATLSMKNVGTLTGNEELVRAGDDVLDKVIERCKDDSRYCEWNFFPLHQYYKATEDTKYLDAMLSVTGDVMKERSLKDLLDANIPVKWWRLYDATGDARYRDHLLRIAREELRARTAQNELGEVVYTTDAGYDVKSYDMPAIWGLYMPAYVASGDEAFLNVAVECFDQADVEHHTNYFWGAADTGKLIKGLEAMTWIADSDPERAEAYRAKTRTALEEILRDRWDTPDNTKFNGDFGFLVSPTEKATNTQGWIIALLLSLQDEQFSISRE